MGCFRIFEKIVKWVKKSFVKKYKSHADETQKELEKRKKQLICLMDHHFTFYKQSFSKSYVLGDLVGEGAHGFVFTAQRALDKKNVAIKFIYRDEIPFRGWSLVGKDVIPSEVATLMGLKHPNIISFLEYMIVPEYVLLVTELHGTSWDVTLDTIENLGLTSPMNNNNEAKGAIAKRRTSCDLFECITARIQKLI